MFRELKSIPITYKRQGFIFFTCLNYGYLSQKNQEQIYQLCLEISPDDYQALFIFLTTDPNEKPAWQISQDFCIPVNRLYKLRKEFYIEYEKRYKFQNNIA